LTLPETELAEFARNADQLREALGRHTVHSTSSVTFSMGGVLSIGVALVGFVAVVIAVSSVLVVQAKREADLRTIQQLQHEVEAIREKADLAAVYNAQQDKRLTMIEAKKP
jgi:esterase/lipase